MQRENLQVTQPSSMPSSPLTSPGAQSCSTSFTIPNNIFTIDTGDPNWQATKSTVRERNAAMFNNELMSDISFVVGSDGMCSKQKKLRSLNEEEFSIIELCFFSVLSKF